MRCQCGADLPDGALFCGECGRGVHVVGSGSSPIDHAATRVVESVRPRAASAEQPARVDRESDVVDGLSPVASDVDAPADEPVDDGSEPQNPVILEPDEVTRLPERRAPRARFALHFSTGESVTVTGTGLIGRRPTAEPGEYFDEYVTLNDPGRSVSKTHLEFGQDGGVLWVSDRFSANGTVVREPDRAPRLCPGGTRARVARGSRVEIGEQFFIVS